jgi:MFS superfamily sulfate permease-like transporter
MRARIMAAAQGLWRNGRARLGRPTGADVTSGMVTGMFSIPEGMAYASIAGFSPVAGLYAGVVPPVLGSLTAPTVLMVTTLTSAIALTSQSVLGEAGLDPHQAGNVAALTVTAGVVMLLMGVLRLGVVLSFVSNAVMVGFSTGIALQIITPGCSRTPPATSRTATTSSPNSSTGSFTSAPGSRPPPASPWRRSPCGRSPTRSDASNRWRC